MKKLLVASLFALSPAVLATPLGPFEITLPQDKYTGTPSINDTDFSWVDTKPGKKGTQIDVVVEQVAPNKIEVNGIDGNDLRSYWSYGVNDASIAVAIVSAIRVKKGLQVQLVVTESKCGNIDCADYTGTNKNKVNTKTNYPVGRTFAVGFAFNDSYGKNLDIEYGSNNEKEYRKMNELGSENKMLVNPAPFLP
ncbi:hypothetical protein [Ferrimonas marina]|uniref:Uncharacterized protein n=1 Tax=Ferrimonas marina TaxID=299255 RepID=A0A1M5MKP0_9GAMM|nr:hypothetical protein [Ferrimonas marina]SHG77479.1 hypothetical protein SAMN02745129_0669 [Ferrimonas marina]